MNDAPDCYGKNLGLEKCNDCIYLQSCRFFVAAERKTKAIENDKFRNTEYIKNVNYNDPLKVIPEITPGKMYTHDEVVALSAFMLRIGRDKKLGPIISAKLAEGVSFAEIGRRQGVTRQAIHKRVGKQLARMLGYKERQLTDSRLLTLSRDEFWMLKLLRAKTDEDDICELMSLKKKEFAERKKKLERKITSWT